MITRKKWEDFRSTGLLLLVNQFLHIFGWAIVMELEDDGHISDAYPARVRFRGFDNDSTTEAYRKVSAYMKANIDQLLEEANE